jgi:hypothetical protein
MVRAVLESSRSFSLLNATRLPRLRSILIGNKPLLTQSGRSMQSSRDLETRRWTGIDAGNKTADRAEPDGRALCTENFLFTLTWPLDARGEGEFDPNPARLAHDEMDLRPLARELWGEFHNDARPTGNAFMQGIQSRSIGDREGQMMKADVGAAIERDRLVRRLDPP